MLKFGTSYFNQMPIVMVKLVMAGHILNHRFETDSDQDQISYSSLIFVYFRLKSIGLRQIPTRPNKVQVTLAYPACLVVLKILYFSIGSINPFWFVVQLHSL